VSCIRCNRFYPSGWYRNPESATMCGQVQCLGCGAMRCHGDGTGRGTCRECYYGIIPGWSGSEGTCSYKGCEGKAAYRYLPGGKAYACQEHGKRVIERQKAKRAAA
jgi:hypothetical protein